MRTEIISRDKRLLLSDVFDQNAMMLLPTDQRLILVQWLKGKSQKPKWETQRQREHYFRTRWLFSLLYLCGLRISEIVCNQMGTFFCRRDRDGEERWWLEILGKGDKLRIVPATNELMVELTRYRRELGLTPFPILNEATPLFL